jgi:hypothetical protein
MPVSMAIQSCSRYPVALSSFARVSGDIGLPEATASRKVGPRQELWSRMTALARAMSK